MKSEGCRNINGMQSIMQKKSQDDAYPSLHKYSYIAAEGIPIDNIIKFSHYCISSKLAPAIGCILYSKKTKKFATCIGLCGSGGVSSSQLRFFFRQ